MSQSGLAPKLKALIFYRAFFVSLLFGAAVLLGADFVRIPDARLFSFFTAGLYGLTAAYGLLYRRLKHSPLFARFQIGGDVFAETVLVYLSGGILSGFPFTFLLTILAASMILAGPAGYLTAAASSLAYGLLLLLQAGGVILTEIPVPADLSASDYFYKAFVQFLAAFSIAFLSSSLANRLRRVTDTLERTDYDYSDLKAFSRDVIQFIPVGLITTDLQGRIMTANPAATRILRRDEARLRGTLLTGIFPFASLEHSYDERLEGEIEVAPDERLTIGLSISPLKNREGRAVGGIVIFRDLTRIRAMEQEMQRKERLASLGELSAWIAHELRNPLASMKSSLALLREEKSPGPDSFRLMDIAIREMDRLDRIITDFLAYARPRPPVKRPFDLAGAVREMLLIFRQRGSVRIREEICDTLMVEGDPDQLRQVFLNLFLNAEQAAGPGGSMSVSVRNGEAGAVVAVSDDGPGVPEGDREKIFYPYYSTKEGGTGLGLAVADRIVQEHHGTIEVDSSPGAGATFTVRLPRHG